MEIFQQNLVAQPLTGTIRNDDALPVVTVTGVNITEGGATADISFSLDKGCWCWVVLALPR